MNITILGGSNSVMATGYVGFLAPTFNKLGVEIKILNKAIGASNCIRGITSLIQSNFHETDVFVLEYTINDRSFFRLCGKEAWLFIYENIIRHIVVKYPRALIVPLILGRATAGAKRIENEMMAALIRVLDQYGIEPLDFQGLLRSQYSQADLDKLYTHAVHYRSPYPVNYLASLLAAHILNNRATPKIIMPEQPYTENPVNGSFEVIDLSGVSGFERCQFENSRYQFQAIRLPAGSALQVRASRRPLSISYVSAPDSCELIVRRSGSPSQRHHTLHRKVQSGSFVFLGKSATVMYNNWRDIQADGPICLEACRSIDVADEFPVKEYNMVPNDADGEQAVYLCSMTLG